MAAVIDEAAADEHRGRDLIELRQLADRVEHDDVGARLGVDRQLGPARDVTKPASRASRSTSPNRSGWRGAMISSALGMRRLDARERRAAPPPLRPASCCRRRSPVRFGGDAEEPQHALARLAVRRRRRRSRANRTSGCRSP